MPKKLQRSLQYYLTKIKNPTPNIDQNSVSSSKNCILSGCKLPKTLSFAIERNQNLANIEDGGAKKVSENHQATLSDVDRFLFENFRSLYIRDDDCGYQKHNDQKGKDGADDRDRVQSTLGGVLFESPRFLNIPPDLCGSDRFFVAPRTSGSLIDEARASLTTTCEETVSSSTSTNTFSESLTSSNDVPKKISLPDDSIAVLKYSSTPCHDFQRSMQEMVDARLQETGKLDWDFMEEILFCYLNLNERKSHKFVLNAFVDLVVKLRQDSDEVPAKSRSSTRVARDRRRRLRKRVA